MSRPVDPTTGLTAKQEAFAQAVAAGSNYSDAFRSSYDVSPSTPGTTLWDEASTLARHPLVVPRIAALKAALAKKRGWDLARMVEQAEKHVEIALSGGYRGVPAANGALEIIGRATGLLTEKQPVLQQPITRVVIVLDHGKDGEGRNQVVEAEYEVLESSELEESDESSTS